MSADNHIFTPGPSPNTVRTSDGKVLTVPEGWILFPPGDAALTRRVKAAGDHWVVQEKRGRKVFSRGVWAPAATVERIRAELAAERSTGSFAKKKEAVLVVQEFLADRQRVGEVMMANEVIRRDDGDLALPKGLRPREVEQRLPRLVRQEPADDLRGRAVHQVPIVDEPRVLQIEVERCSPVGVVAFR